MPPATNRRAVTQSDIARALGIGQKTVSRAFTDPESVSANLRERIEAIARRRGYRPHDGARAMRTGRFNHILIVQSRHGSASTLPGRVLDAVLERCGEVGVGVGIAQFDDVQLSEDTFLPRVLATRNADGIILNYDTNVPALLEAHARKHALPTVWFNAKRDEDAVRPDDFSASKSLCERLIALGHRRILYADAHLRWTGVRHYSRDDRLLGYRTAMAAAGAEPREWLPSEPVLDERFVDPFVTMLRAADRPTAAIGYGDSEVAALMIAAARVGLDVPNGLSLATFDGVAAFVGLPIATAIIDHAGLGRATADQLLARIAAPRRHSPTIVLPFSFVPGATLAPVPQ